MRKSLGILVLILLLLSAQAYGAELYVRPMEDLPEDFFLGMDVSSVLAEEASGVKYYDAQGRERDLFALLAENGVFVGQCVAGHWLFDPERAVDRDEFLAMCLAAQGSPTLQGVMTTGFGDDEAEVFRKRRQHEYVAPLPGPFLLLSGKRRLDAQLDVLQPGHGLFQKLYAL